jgi:septum formation protein
MRKIVLASSSPRRREILEMSGIPFTVEPSDYEEDMSLSLPPQELAVLLASGKAQSVALRHPNALIIGADTFVVLGAEVIGKPYTADRAKEMLRSLSDTWHQIITGYCIIDTRTGTNISGAEISRVKFKPLSDAEINSYIATGEPLDRAGAYAIQGGAAKFVERIEGNYLSILGLPLIKILKELEAFGICP